LEWRASGSRGNVGEGTGRSLDRDPGTQEEKRWKRGLGYWRMLVPGKGGEGWREEWGSVRACESQSGFESGRWVRGV